MKIGLFYGSTTCYTEIIAEKIQALIGADLVDIVNIKDQSLALCLDYDFIIFGISTWDYGEIQEDWESIWSDINQLDLSDKIIALYGMGDQIGYSEWFQDALGMLHEQVLVQGAKTIGYWPIQGYEFTASKALTADGELFVGLSLDEDSQYNLTDDRLDTWCEQVLLEYSSLL
ncbi:flavodoxin [Colwellia sp. MT41]|uniref:Flavodoxin n=1 Tax=Colwellia marinimaniae TaxID=1513592 RepID=A0ABQ0MU60_9GAMM|nr:MULTISPECIES: flavodoxin FldB [Colwellia]ALO35698.1 flavodoxin [Colwellia sp. MT41]GAW95913.1 flavodoxin [Colwellia marinimaniae]